ncbi:hypothetical protein NBO_10g0059 [Nosema bombycis CQ1]|uniref:Uncharacterized protein n=1 Tax=Nosema bombycis (strain CQ1 / CVCC 102059) TaxID=578461 RepID=R0MAS5_NOSB1|nr:hypothetical protein NBO_10g0059 [Nosema bombycis CQ1]|eukprot:EOB15069.1 hypothetical protein NBO_10g0059 [Nosema bombycis CQ1]
MFFPNKSNKIYLTEQQFKLKTMHVMANFFCKIRFAIFKLKIFIIPTLPNFQGVKSIAF